MALSYGNSRLRDLYYRCPNGLKECITLAYSFQQRRRRFGGAFAPFLSELERNAHRTPQELAEDQLARLQFTLGHAAASVPYYRSLFAELGFDPAGVVEVGDLGRLPLLDKETVREQHDRLIAMSGAGPAIPNHTSGTTGKGLHLLMSLEGYQRSYACAWFHYGWNGIRRGDRVATVAGHPVAAPDDMHPPFWIHDRLERELLFSSQHLMPDTLPSYADALAGFQPTLLRGYPSSIYLLALHLREAGREDIRPRAVYTSSETLFDHQRRVIEEAFGCQAFSYYSNAERVAHILQCAMGRFHVVTETCIVEVLNPDGTPTGPGHEGELVCTSLINPAMPLIRYRIGDTGTVAEGECRCGLHTPTLSSITGRVEDIVVTPDGRHVGRLDHAFKDMLNVREAQIVQENVDSILVKIAPRDGFGPSDERAIVAELRLRLGPQIGIRFEIVDRIPRLANGKFRFVVSKVPLVVGSGTGAGPDARSATPSAG